MLPTQVGMNRWKQETCVSAKSIDSHVIGYPLSLHKHVGGYGDETSTWFWPDPVVMERWCFLIVEGKLGPSQNLHFHHDYCCCHLLCSLMSSNVNRSPSVRSVSMFTSISSLAAADNWPHCVKAASHFSFRDRSNQPKCYLVKPTTNRIALG